MTNEQVLERLLQGQRSIEESSAKLGKLLLSSHPDIASLTEVRWEIGTRLMQHMAYEDRHLYANLAAHPDPTTAALGKKYQLEYGTYMQGYADHAKAWTPARVFAEWEEYRRVTRGQLQAAAERIARVRRELYPLLAQSFDATEAKPPSRSWARDAFDIKARIGKS